MKNLGRFTGFRAKLRLDWHFQNLRVPVRVYTSKSIIPTRVYSWRPLFASYADCGDRKAVRSLKRTARVISQDLLVFGARLPAAASARVYSYVRIIIRKERCTRYVYSNQIGLSLPVRSLCFNSDCSRSAAQLYIRY